MAIKSLIINPGSTSTKIGVFEDETLLFEETLRHSTEEIAQYEKIVDQKDFRRKIIEDLLKEKEFDIKSLNMVVGRGGMLKPIPGGTYAVTDDLLEDLKIGVQGPHASNLGGILAREIGDSIGVPSYIVDPVVVDELEPVSRYSGVPELPRTSVFHALNQKAVAKRYAKEQGKAYDSLNLVVVHMGGGGFNAYCGTNDMRDVEKMVQGGDKKAEEVREAFITQVAKDIGAMACVLQGKVDQIIVTGGIAYDKVVVAGLKEKAEWIAPMTVYPGEDELMALVQGGLRILRGEEELKVY